MADQLIEAGLLNRWQLNNLLKGKYKGFTLGKYKLLGHLGTGGMSSVYLAEHPVMERLVAVKVLPKKFVENPNYLDRFKREARAVAALDHPNIVRAFDIDQDGDTHYIVMEYVDGRDLQKIVVKDGPLEIVDAMDFIAQSALGLQHAHDAGVIHRDIKPANCLVDKRRCVKLLDMGLAMFSEDDRPSLSAKYDDSVVGTADYLAPEQARNSQTVDTRADIYSLGCTLYFLLTGQPPFPNGSIAERLLKHQTDEPQSLLEFRKDIPPAVLDLCRRMMAKDPEHRIQTARQVADEIRSWMSVRGKSITFDQHLASAPDRKTDSGWSRSPSSGLSSIGRPPAGDTVSSSHGDTHVGSDSTINDDLGLAPIDEDARASTSSSGLHDDDRRHRRASKKNEKESSSIDELELQRYGSGPLDALLEDPTFEKRVQMPKRQLTVRREVAWYETGLGIAGIIGGLILLLGLAFLILMAQ
ncbi:MAG: serine/threonine-protein kinase [Planctomycetota bacterium]